MSSPLPPSTPKKNSNNNNNHVSDEALQTLLAIGVDSILAVQALRYFNNNVERSADALLSGRTNFDIIDTTNLPPLVAPPASPPDLALVPYSAKADLSSILPSDGSIIKATGSSLQSTENPFFKTVNFNLPSASSFINEYSPPAVRPVEPITFLTPLILVHFFHIPEIRNIILGARVVGLDKFDKQDYAIPSEDEAVTNMILDEELEPEQDTNAVRLQNLQKWFGYLLLSKRMCLDMSSLKKDFPHPWDNGFGNGYIEVAGIIANTLEAADHMGTAKDEFVKYLSYHINMNSTGDNEFEEKDTVETAIDLIRPITDGPLTMDIWGLIKQFFSIHSRVSLSDKPKVATFLLTQMNPDDRITLNKVVYLDVFLTNARDESEDFMSVEQRKNDLIANYEDVKKETEVLTKEISTLSSSIIHLRHHSNLVLTDEERHSINNSISFIQNVMKRKETQINTLQNTQTTINELIESARTKLKSTKTTPYTLKSVFVSSTRNCYAYISITTPPTNSFDQEDDLQVSQLRQWYKFYDGGKEKVSWDTISKDTNRIDMVVYVRDDADMQEMENTAMKYSENFVVKELKVRNLCFVFWG